MCGFGADRYADEGACEDAYNGYDSSRQDCVVEHLQNADNSVPGSADENEHCGHATGLAPCD